MMKVIADHQPRTGKIKYKTPKSEWAKGPWIDELDYAWWYEGQYLMTILRPKLGTLCGYVGVPKDHVGHGINYDELRVLPGNWFTRWYYRWKLNRAKALGVPPYDLPFDWIEVHGGLNYTDTSKHQYHVIKDPEYPRDYWNIGFDCAHSGDTSMMMYPDMFNQLNNVVHTPITYRDFPYVYTELQSLKAQLNLI